MFLMGDLRYWSNDTNSRISEESQLSPAAAPTSSSKFWMKGEEGTACIIGQVQPTLISEQRRNAVIEYVQRLIKTTHGCEVFPFGSVPLKTYLPDGDIDLTAFGAPHAEETLVNQVFSVLEKEEENDSAPFVVKDVQLIRAEVKLVKCLVQNIVVDISFNQLGGLCTLCFLEKVDGLIGKDHLFKRSIILIKAWCYYESRILGAHHGLISTYALETLVLYIFHLFHTSLDGPLVVLYKFLDYFSKFDWDNYGISLKGPFRLSSLPELVVETLEISGGDLLLTDDFLKECLDIYSLPSIGVEATSRRFPQKHLNIVDPLKENNNLGRSVNKGNFYRIRSAFTYGSQKLGRVLSEPKDNVAAEVRKFFSNTLDRHGSGQRPDVQDLIPSLGYNASGAMPPFSGAESAPDNSCQEDRTLSENISLGPTEPSLRRDGFVGDAKSLAITSIQQLTITTDSDTSFSTDRGVHGFPLIKPFSPLHHVRNGEMLNGMEQPDVSSFDESDAVSDIGPTSDETTGITIQKNGSDSFLASPESLCPIDSARHYSPMSLASWPQEDVYAYNYGNGVTTNLGGAADASNLLSDLRGDYDNQISSLRYGRWWFDYVHNFRIAPMPPPALSQAQSCNSWDIVRHAMPFRQNMMSPMNANRVVCSQTFFPGNPSMNLRASFGREKMPKPHGTGTYFPNASHYRDRPFSPRGQHQHPTRSPRNNGRAATHAEAYWGRRSSRERESYSHQSDARRVSSDAHHLGSPEEKELPNASGSLLPPDSVVDSRSISHLSLEGSISHLSLEDLDTGSNRRPKAGIGSRSLIAGMHKDRTTAESYRLKDENDFPPLSV